MNASNRDADIKTLARASQVEISHKNVRSSN